MSKTIRRVLTTMAASASLLGAQRAEANGHLPSPFGPTNGVYLSGTGTCPRFADGAPVFDCSWGNDDAPRRLDGWTNTYWEHLADNSRLMFLAGVRVRDGVQTFHTFVTEALDNWPYGYFGYVRGLTNHPEDPDQSPLPDGWWFWPNSTTDLYKCWVDVSCFETAEDWGGAGYANVIVGGDVKVHSKGYYTGIESCNFDDNAVAGPWGYSSESGAGSVGFFNAFSLPGWGFGEWIRITQGGGLNQPPILDTHSEDCGETTDVVVFGQMQSLIVEGGDNPAQMIGPANDPTPSPGGTPGPYSTTGSYHLLTDPAMPWIPATRTLAMARQDSAFCFITGLSGKFVTSELAWIDTVYIDGVFYWQLNVNRGNDGSVQVWADCMQYVQQRPI